MGSSRGYAKTQFHFANAKTCSDGVLSNLQGGKHDRLVNKLILIVLIHLQMPVTLNFIAITENCL